MRTVDRRDAEARKRLFRKPSRRHKWLLGVLLFAHVALLLAVIFTTQIVHLDWWVMLKHPNQRLPQFDTPLNVFIVLGQRWPSVAMISPWLLWKTWKERSWRPIMMTGIALLLLNLTVGAVKLGLGRLGPHYNFDPWTSGILLGGDIMPSGHTANAVVTWGLLAYLARRWRKRGAMASSLLAFGIGATTVYLGTHWVSDVLDGWVAGALVLALVPLFEPAVQRVDLRLQALWFRLRRTYSRKPLDELLPGPPHPLPGAGGRPPAAVDPAAGPEPVGRRVTPPRSG